MVLFESRLTLCDPYLSASEAFAKTRYISRRYLYLWKRGKKILRMRAREGKKEVRERERGKEREVLGISSSNKEGIRDHWDLVIKP